MKSLHVLAYVVGFFVGINAVSVRANEDTGEQLFSQHCGSCHGATGHPRQAPPARGIRKHVLAEFPSEDAFVKHLTQWIANPDPEKAIIEHAVKRFGAMPSIALQESDAIKIATYLYASNEHCRNEKCGKKHRKQSNNHAH